MSAPGTLAKIARRVEKVRDTYNGIGVFSAYDLTCIADDLLRIERLSAATGAEAVAWRDMAYMELGIHRDKMTPEHVEAVQKFLRGEFVATPPPSPDAAVREAWQPIETAPKDGTAIMLCNEVGSWIGKYVPVYQSGFRPDDLWFSLMLNMDSLPRVAGRYGKPTGWMPLPAPPRALAGGGSS